MNNTIIRGDLIPPLPSTGKAEVNKSYGGKDFNTVLKETLEDINRLQLNADDTINKIQLEKAGSIHEAMIALEKASISFKAMMQVRNKILDAYQEVMRMQV